MNIRSAMIIVVTSKRPKAMVNATVANILNKFHENEHLKSQETYAPTATPLIDVEEQHEEDAYSLTFLNIILIICIIIAYIIKERKLYFLPESAAAMLLGTAVGFIVNVFVQDVTLFKFSPEFFFFVLLPPIIFEAGYGLEKQAFFENIGAITMYAVFGTIISTFTVGYLVYWCGKHGYIDQISTSNPMEGLLFGALISAVDPVATLSIMNNPELQCNKLLYSLVFGESVLNDAVAIVLFNTFKNYYDPDTPDLSRWDIPKVFMSFLFTSVFSILVGGALGLCTSYLYKHSNMKKYPNMESTLLFLMCYLCYAVGESLGLSGIMALFFNGIVLSHYNSHNLSESSKHATEQIFATLATISETIVFLYMGMGVFTGRFADWNWRFSLFAMMFCLIGRFLNIFPLSLILNIFRERNKSHISKKMQSVLWFAGLRGAIAFALAENFPGDNRDTYATGTLSICFMTTIICGGFTERMLSITGMKENHDDKNIIDDREVEDGEEETFFDDNNFAVFSSPSKDMEEAYKGIKKVVNQFDKKYLVPRFGGELDSPMPKETTDERKLELELELETMSKKKQSNSGIDDDDVIDEFELEPMPIGNGNSRARSSFL